MAFKPTKKDYLKAQLCPVGMRLLTLTDVEKPYLNDKGTEIQKCDFEDSEGYIISNWFNDKMLDTLINFVESADNVKLDPENMPVIELRDYIGKKVAASISHRKVDDKMRTSIDEFYTADKVPF